MSFSIADILKPDRDSVSKERKKKRNETSKIFHYHDHFDGIGALRRHSSHFRRRTSDDDFMNKSEHENEDDEVETTPTTISHRKRRILFTREQTYQLQKVFQCQQYLTVPQRDYLSRKINLTSTQVKIWFQNHRYKLKKHLKECNVNLKPSPPSSRRSPPPIPLKTPWFPQRHHCSSLYVTEHSLFPRDRDHLLKLERTLTPPPPSTAESPNSVSSDRSPLIHPPPPQRPCSCPGECTYFEQDNRHFHTSNRNSASFCYSDLPILCDCEQYARFSPVSKHFHSRKEN